MTMHLRTLLMLALLMSAGCRKESASTTDGTPGSESDPSTNVIQVVAFDEADETLQAIIDGEMYGTVVQNPYMYGYESVKLLSELANDKNATGPEGGFMDIPARMIRQDDAEAFWTDKKEKLEAGEGEPEIEDGRDYVAYVTNGVDPFWTIAAAGAKVAGREFGVNVDLRFPPKGAIDQKSMLEALLVRDEVKGIAVSPIDPENQRELLNQIGDSRHFITHDSDAPDSNRLAYIGMDNYSAGRMCGKLVKEAMPNGGSVMIFVGRLGQLNAEQRRQGVIDELLDRPDDPERRDPPNEVIKGKKYTILGTRTDNFDPVRAKQNAQDAISKHPDLGCMVGLFAYNPPQCLQAVKEAGREARPSVSSAE